MIGPWICLLRLVFLTHYRRITSFFGQVTTFLDYLKIFGLTVIILIIHKLFFHCIV